MIDDELDEKIKIFRGKKDEIKDAEEDSGKLMEDEENEEITITKKTYKKILSMSGGMPFLVLLIICQIGNAGFEWLSNEVRSTWATESQENQQEMFGFYMKKIIGITSLGALFIFVKVYLLAKMNNDMSQGFHTDIMAKVMNAPVNTFFDITPVGKILVRFSKDLEVFKGGLFWSISHTLNMAATLFVVIVFLIYVNPFNIIFIGMTALLMKHFSEPYFAADNQLHKVSTSVWSPIHSYWQEVLRGGSVIRAFKGQDKFIEREFEMMDKTTIQFIAHHSCWVWFNLRLFYTCKLVAAAGMIVCLTMKGQVNSVTLSLVLTYTLDLDWV